MQRKLAAVAGMAALFATLPLFVLAQGALANHSITDLVSTGPSGGNGPYDVYSPNFLISRDGSRVTFITGERLTSDDTNNLYDAYQWSGGVTTLLTGGKITRGDGGMRLIGASQDGRRVFIETGLQLLSSDQDGEADVYEWADGTLTLETVDANGQNSIFPIVTLFEYINADGTHLFFSTAARLTSDDTNNDFDIYERTGGVTRLVSTGPNGN